MAENVRQKLILTDRKMLEITGVSSVESFDSDRVELSTVLGGLVIAGEEMTIANLNLDVGEVAVTGYISALAYGKNKEEKTMKHKSKNVLGRIMK